ncbi:hypothetical protein D9758_006473 [Tetrapyrgos nigripes]|uniref:Intradiol ring-cleavage dioxygenases domain-containing protein n=1 Tax=Tetrapyrgos nigripes TaxID=182062 RepID=A0A8H5GKU4_9AGAR|nr:hypothetical protein D9758_006473 [Tetrapyrgos nigripes]
MVFVSSLLSAALAVASLVELTAAHRPPQPGSPEAVKRDLFQRNARRSLADCQDELSKRGGVYEKARARRANFARDARGTRGLSTGVPYKRATFEDYLKINHHSNETGITNNTDPATLFDGNSSCVLAPEVTEGPYYVTGEYVRFDVRENQSGIDHYTEVQFIDVSTCEPVPGIYVDFWHANATGVYAGVVINGNGAGENDATNINSTFLRGIQETDSDGVVQFLSVFPGHYQGRAIHTHIVAHQAGTQFPNGTFASANVSHIGQLFWDQSLISTVSALEPYSSNTQNLTLNADDMWAPEQADGIDPFPEYVFLGDDVTDGIFGWISIGIDTTSSYSIINAATLTEDGGVANAAGSFSGGGGGGMPSAMPSASASA